MINRSQRKVIQQSLIYLFLIIFVVFALFPLVWGIATSFKPNAEMGKARWFPKHFILQHYRTILNHKMFFRSLVNSTIVSFLSTILSIFLALLGGYGFSRFKFTGRRLLFLITLGVQYLPTTTLIVPFFILVLRLRLLDTLWGLTLYFLTISVPLATWLLTNYLAGVPVEVEEAAMLDGCSRLRVLYKVVLPIIIPGAFVSMVLIFLQTWQAYLMPLVLTQTMRSKTVPIIIQELETQASFGVGPILAGTMLFCSPVVLGFLVVHKYFMSGIEIVSYK